jgi:hypothetical protein
MKWAKIRQDAWLKYLLSTSYCTADVSNVEKSGLHELIRQEPTRPWPVS